MYCPVEVVTRIGTFTVRVGPSNVSVFLGPKIPPRPIWTLDVGLKIM